MSGVTPARARREKYKAATLEEQIKSEKYVEFRLACEDGEPTGCHSLGEWFGVVKGDFATAVKLYTENCLERKHGPSCYNMGRFHANGRHVEKSTSKTLDYLLRGCDGNNADSCHYGALLLLDRANVKHDPRRAVKMLDKACTKLTGGALSCAKLGSMKLMVMYHKGDGVARDEAEARRLMDDAKQLMRQEGILKDRPAGPLVKGKRGS